MAGGSVPSHGAHPTWPKDGIGILSYQVQVLLWNPKAAGQNWPLRLEKLAGSVLRLFRL